MSHRRIIVPIIVLCALISAGLARATDYYVTPRGNDSNPGTTARPWRSLAKVNNANLAAGDRVLLEGGQTFDGNLVLDERVKADPQRPVTIGSFGQGRAVIQAGLGTGILIRNIGGIVVRDLVVKSDDAVKNQGFGIMAVNERGAARLDFIRIENVDVSGFRWSGIYVGGVPTLLPGFKAPPESRYGYRNVLIAHSTAHHNTYYGIFVSGPWDRIPGGYANEKVTIQDCVAHDNVGDPKYKHHSGDGILIDNTDGGLIERSAAYHNGGSDGSSNGGPVGIWANSANRITIQFCESYANHTAGRHDGGGFDLDGGVSNSVVQYNYSHDNDGPGFLVWNYGEAPHRLTGDVIRYNLSANDARKHQSSIMIGTSGEPVDHLEIYNNTIVVTKTANEGPPLVWVRGTRENTNIRFWNNLFISDADAALIQLEEGQKGVLFQGNAYWRQGKGFWVSDQGTGYHELATWRAKTGQETLDGKPVGISADPRMGQLEMNATLASGSGPTALPACHLLSGSPLIDGGLDLHAAFGIDVGSRDLWGTHVPQGRAFDIGALEAPAGDGIKRSAAAEERP